MHNLSLRQNPLRPHSSQQSVETTVTTHAEFKTVDNTENKQNNSAAAELGFPCHIQPVLNLTEFCNDPSGSLKRTPANADEDISVRLHPNGRNICLEKNDVGFLAGVKPDLMAKLTPDKIRALASDDAATYLDALQDWREAIPFILRELGINISAWLDAVEVMGEPIAFLALIVIDRNRFHPVVPVHSPGGALRAFTRKAQSGELNLTRAIIGIWERERQGKQPKAAPRPERVQ